jgi:hypothetical protein
MQPYPPHDASSRNDGTPEVAQEPKPHLITIIVNTRPYQWEKGKISFDEVVKIAYPTPPGPDTVYTVSYSKGADKKPNGTLVAEQDVEVKDEMIFSVTATNKS